MEELTGHQLETILYALESYENGNDELTEEIQEIVKILSKEP